MNSMKCQLLFKNIYIKSLGSDLFSGVRMLRTVRGVQSAEPLKNNLLPIFTELFQM